MDVCPIDRPQKTEERQVQPPLGTDLGAKHFPPLQAARVCASPEFCCVVVRETLVQLFSHFSSSLAHATRTAPMRGTEATFQSM